MNAKKPFSHCRSSHAARYTSQEGRRPPPEHWSGAARTRQPTANRKSEFFVALITCAKKCSSKVQQQSRSSAMRRVPQRCSRVLNDGWRHPRAWFGTKRPQVQILSPRPVFPQARGPAPSGVGPSVLARTATTYRNGVPRRRCATYDPLDPHRPCSPNLAVSGGVATVPGRQRGSHTNG